jgi:hypothetical protein
MRHALPQYHVDAQRVAPATACAQTGRHPKWAMANGEWRNGAGGAGDGRCAETRQRATLRDCETAHARQAHDTHYTHYAAGYSWRTATRDPRPATSDSAPGRRPGRRPRHGMAGCSRGWSVGLRAPHPNGLRRRAWPGPMSRLDAAPRNPETQRRRNRCAPDSTVAPPPSPPLRVRFSHSCCQAALRSQNYRALPQPQARLLCSCSLLRLWPPANPTLHPSLFALLLALFAILPLRPLPSTLLRCCPCPSNPTPLLKH